MNLNLISIAALACSAVLSAQSPLNVFPSGTGGAYGWGAPAPAIHNHFFDLAVTNTITLQALTTPLLSPVGQQGTYEIWLTNPGITTYVGSEVTAANWTLATSGRIIANGSTGGLATITVQTCQQTPGGSGLVLNPGSYGVCMRYVGVTPLFYALTANQTYSNADLAVSGGNIAAGPTQWPPVQAPPATQPFWRWRGQIIYALGSVPHACAESAPYGSGCYTVGGSTYQEFVDVSPTNNAAVLAAQALNGRSLRFIPTGPSYLVLPGTATGYVAPSAAATVLTLADDAEIQVSLSVPLNYPGGTTSTLFVHSNGYVSVASNNTLPGGSNVLPETSVMLGATNAAWWSWHDYNPTEAGSGQIKFEEVGGIAYVTWDGVESDPATTANPSTFQFQFNLASGEVNIVWTAITNIPNAGLLQGSDHLIGFSPGGASPASGAINITTLTSQLLAFPEVFPLKLASSSKPLIGTTVNLVTSNETNSNLGICFVTTGQIPAPGLDLGLIGAPGCSALVDINTGVGNLISNLGLPGVSMSVAFPLPNNPALAGLSIYSQSIWLDPTVNAFGMLVSNGIDFVLGNF